MKIQYRQVESFLKNPPATCAAILVYGPDNGLMKERARLLGQTAVADLGDPFNVVTLKMDEIAEDPARLGDEANALSMMGGRRLVRVEDARDTLATSLKDYLSNPNDNTLVVIEAGELSPRSALRILCEKSDKAAALACYVEDERDIVGLIRQTLQEQQYRIDREAALWLAANIVGDRQRARSEIEKLITYMGSQKSISIEDVQACCGVAGAQGMDDLIYNVAGAQTEASFKAFNTLMEEGLPVIALLRGLQNHFRRLHLARACMDSGQSAEQAMKSLKPPIFFKQEAAFKAQLGRWPLNRLEVTLQKLAGLEAQCKQTNMPVETLCAQALLAISAGARR